MPRTPIRTTSATTTSNSTMRRPSAASSSRRPIVYSERASQRIEARGESKIKVIKNPQQRARPRKEALFALLTGAMGEGEFVKKFTKKDLIFDTEEDDEGNKPNLMATGVHFVGKSYSAYSGHFKARRFKDENNDSKDVIPTNKNTELIDSYKKGWQQPQGEGFCQTFAIMAFMRKDKVLDNIVNSLTGTKNQTEQFIKCSKEALRFIADEALPFLLQTGAISKNVSKLALHCYFPSLMKKLKSSTDLDIRIKQLRRQIYRLIDDEEFGSILNLEEYKPCP